MKNIETIDLKLHNNKGIGLFIQALLISLIIILWVIIIFIPEFITILYALLALTMFIMAYNNVKFYHKKYFTFIYILVGIFITVSTILELLNG